VVSGVNTKVIMEPEKSLIRDFISGGWLIPVIGALGMIARIMVGTSNESLWTFSKKVISAAIASGIAWFILDGAPVSDFAKAICYGMVGVVSPEIINGIVTLAKKVEKNPEKYIKPL
jgi:hypothetical protein